MFHFNGGDLDGAFEVHPLASAWVSHFATCPKARDFSRGKKKPVDERAAELDAEREMGDDRSWENRG